MCSAITREARLSTTLPSNVGANLVFARVQRDSEGNGEQNLGEHKVRPYSSVPARVSLLKGPLRFSPR